ncbi:GAF domain-containing protein [Amycolatopsis acidiphila]|uniref:GAF domain-containing protein n=1 Tax=Amycolatopsis acidiphila TaxID=715473 RepID=A0A558AGC6_9PSEU|nr:helix-turn-helix domain-containing protein [Amycolatopsis acidiphila]TVT23314.1 GAF domain-containing protein [Amycolatopsis acidiphila]UIJ56539.1 GAF domain-containing protein [Amycolatopsis acidiphila]GHG66741.1 Fis family transcriptional regulator [Amycolatopsis acidiphila]
MDRVTAILPDDEGLARTREKFLTAESVEPDQVREAILASWWRSREFQVPADRIDLPYSGEQNPDTPLIRGAAPVLERLGDQLEGQPISLILTDPSGVVLSQRTGDTDLHRHLERVELVPGYSYGEQFVGTNGIGTALEDGRPTYVFGHEHYAEHLETLACAGVPIQHPITGKTIGAVDLTCWRKDAGGLLVALARTTAEQVRQALLTHSNLRELVLFQSYLQACRRTTGIVMAFNKDIVMMNDSARQLLAPADQTMLLSRANQELAESRRATATVTLSSGSKVRVYCRRVKGHRDGDIAGGVLSVKLIESDDVPGSSALPMLPMFLPGVVGSAAPWLRASHDVDTSFSRGEWVALAGEPGTGKYTLARGVHQRRNPTGRLHVLDAARMTEDWQEDLRRELIDDPVDTLVVRHVERLARPDMETLVSVLREAAGGGTWVTVTLSTDAEADPELLALFPRTVTVPPLRRHAEDLNDLVPLFLSRLAGGGQLTCSPAALHLLMRANWPGNVAQLYRVLKQIAKRRRTGTIAPTDLPAEYHALTRRQLNRFETVERDAIVRSLEDADGNKVRAAKLLGISRATIYRKIHEYGIVTSDR